MSEYPTEGMVLIDKPLTWTSFDVVKKLRRLAGVKKIGHAGTLDPLATGLLILCYGKYTKKINEIQEQEKTYTGTFYLGKTTPSFDLETEVDSEKSISHLDEQQLRSACQKFIGQIMQTPPVFSAVKVDGKRAYELARSGQEVALKSKPVTLYEFELTRIDLPEVDFKIRCSKGTYIRSIARDFGQALNCGAHLIALRRTAIGNYSVEDAVAPNDLKERNDFYLHSIS